MKRSILRDLIRETIKGELESLKVVKAKKIKIDQFGKYSITLSNGMKDSVNINHLDISRKIPNMHGCQNIFGTMKGENENLGLTYEFEGLECEGYVKLDTEKIKIVN